MVGLLGLRGDPAKPHSCTNMEFGDTRPEAKDRRVPGRKVRYLVGTVGSSNGFGSESANGSRAAETTTGREDGEAVESSEYGSALDTMVPVDS